MLRKFYTFYTLGPKSYFGGRVLVAESSVTTEGKVLNANGQTIIQPSQLSVVANSAEVEVLIFNKNEITFLPEEVQVEIVYGLRKTQNYERPYSNATTEQVKLEFGKWDDEKH